LAPPDNPINLPEPPFDFFFGLEQQANQGHMPKEINHFAEPQQQPEMTGVSRSKGANNAAPAPAANVNATPQEGNLDLNIPLHDEADAQDKDFDLKLPVENDQQEGVQEVLHAPNPGQLSFQVSDAPHSGNPDCSVGHSEVQEASKQ
jgi:hypothetical protein